jgi:tRNA(Ile)-lysidine synthase
MHPLVKYVNDNIHKNFSENLCYCVALSGGIDSVVLLHILTQLRSSHHNLNLVAMHINHGISPNAILWQNFCDNICMEWSVPFVFKQYLFKS